MEVKAEKGRHCGILKVLLCLALLIAVTICALTYLVPGLLADRKVEYTILDGKDIPKEIETEIIPQYRDLERALGCMTGGKVYVVVTRGEKPTAGFKVDITGIKLEKKEGESCLKVEAAFDDPDPDEAVAQIISYPYAVAETNLTVLPDSIELITKFE